MSKGKEKWSWFAQTTTAPVTCEIPDDLPYPVFIKTCRGTLCEETQLERQAICTQYLKKMPPKSHAEQRT